MTETTAWTAPTTSVNCRGAGHRRGQFRLFGYRLLKGMLLADRVTCRRPGCYTQGGCASEMRQSLITDESDVGVEEFRQTSNLVEGCETTGFIYGAI